MQSLHANADGETQSLVSQGPNTAACAQEARALVGRDVGSLSWDLIPGLCFRRFEPKLKTILRPSGHENFLNQRG